jgi:hypothetical protein
MSLDIQFKETESAPAMVVGYYDLKDQIARGDVGPKSLVCDRVLTHGEWWTLDNLNFFHKTTPIRHPAGPLLQQRQNLCREREEKEKRSWQLQSAYIHGNLIEESFHLSPLAELIKGKNVPGATRLFVLRSFEPERIFTFIFAKDCIHIEAVQGQTSLWYSLPQVCSINGVWTESAGKPFDSAQILKASNEIGLDVAPVQLKSWSELLAATQAATDCSNRRVDGSTFRHQLCSPHEALSAAWNNPDAKQDVFQSQLLMAYFNCLETAKLGHFWQRDLPQNPSRPVQ